MDIHLQLPAWLPIQAAHFFLAGVGGLLAHFISQRAQGRIRVNLITYLLFDRPGFTLATLLALVAADFAAVGVGGLEDMKYTTSVALGFTAGWTADSAIAPHED